MTVLNHSGVVITIPDDGKPEALLVLGDESCSFRMPTNTSYDDFRLHCEQAAQALVNLATEIAGAEQAIKHARTHRDDVLTKADLKIAQCEAARDVLQTHLSELLENWAARKD